MRVMVLWSGGVESTSLLKWVLMRTDWQVHAHHVRLDNGERRADMEDRALHALLPRLTTLRKFSGISYSSVSVCAGHATPPDYWLLYPIGAAAAQHKRCDMLLRGWSAEDDWTRFVSHDGKRTSHELRHERGEHGRWADQLEVLRPFVPDWTTPAGYCPYLEPHGWTKAEHMAHLGDWAQHTWSCRRPKANRPCGECFSCHAREAAVKGRSAIPALCHG